MALDAELAPLYSQQLVVRNRTATAINYWAGYWASRPIPPPEDEEFWDEEKERPTEKWVKQRILSDRVTRYPQNYLDPSMNYYSQDANIQTNMRDLMDGFPTPEERNSYATIMEAATSSVMTRMAESDVDSNAVNQWYINNGFVV